MYQDNAVTEKQKKEEIHEESRKSTELNTKESSSNSDKKQALGFQSRRRKQFQQKNEGKKGCKRLISEWEKLGENLQGN